MNTTLAKGRCLCGAVRFEVSGPPNWVGHCHCRSCRRNASAAMVTYTGFDPQQVRWTAGERRFFASSPGVRRGFCADCGTPLSFESDQFPGEVHLYVNSMDEPERFSPTFHVFYAEHVAWLKLADDLPRYAATTASARVVDDA